MKPLYINEDNLIEWAGAQLASNDAYVTTGTATWSLKNSSGTELATGSLTCTDVATGTWQGTIDKASVTSLTVDAVYVVEITITSGTNEGFRRVVLKAAYHGDQ